jgi:pimeloyl-ACP methyl ester carboxylesterase
VIAERSIEVAGARTRVLEVEGPRPDHPVVFFHGNPSNVGDWVPFLNRLEGRRRCIAADMIGWGESERPPDFPWTIESLVDWAGELLDALAVERFDVVCHDWGVIGLGVAQRRPAAAGRIVIMNAVPLSAGYRWHWVARLWRRRRVGEFLNATTTRFATRQLLKPALRRREPIPELTDLIHEHYDAGTKRAVLRLYRDADPDRLEALGRDLAALRGPALIVWGDADPYIGRDWGDRFAQSLGCETRIEHLPDAGHWPWLDRPDVIDTVAAFLE